MTDSRYFEFNLIKARQSICIFVFSSLVLVSLVILINNDLGDLSSESVFIIFILVFFYFGYLAVLLRRLFIAYFRNEPKIYIQEGVLFFPTFHLGKKRIKLAEICTLETNSAKRNSDFFILGLLDKGRCIVDKSLFLKKTDYYDLKKFIQETVEINSNVETRDSIDRISLSQKNRYTLSTIIIAIFCIFALFLSTSANLELPDSAEFFELGSGTRDVIATREFYRVFSSSFLHVGIFHLLLNLFVLGVMGELLERAITSIRFVNIFLLSSLFAYVSFVIFSDFEMGVGASGGIFGLWGAYFSLKLRYEKYLPGSINAIPLKHFMLVIVTEFLMEIFLFDNVGYEVHIAGFLAGFVYLYFAPLGPKLETIDQPTIAEKGLFIILVASYTVGLSYFLLLYYGLT